jgi:hypothetical protein
VVSAGVVLLLGIGGGAMAIRSMVGTSPHPRQVAVPVPPAAPAGTGSVTFSDGSVASVLAIGETPSQSTASWIGSVLHGAGGPAATPTQPKQWWAADGSPQPAPSIARSMGQVSVGDSMGRQLLFLFSLRGPAVNDSGLAIRISGIGAMASSSRTVGQEDFESFAAAFPANQDHADVRLGISKGAWREDASIAPPTTTQPTTRVTGGTGGAYFTKISQIGSDVVVEINQNRTPSRGTDRDVRMVAILKNGKTVGSHEWRGSVNGTGEVHFKCRLDQLDRVAFTTRPYEWQTIRNVALRPPEPTTRVATK